MKKKEKPTVLFYGDNKAGKSGRKAAVMMEYKLWVTIPGKGRIVVLVVANSPFAAMEAAKAQGGPGSCCGIMSSRSI